MNKPRILIVEDESVIAMDIEEALLSLSYDVAGTAVSGEEAIAVAQSSKPSLVLMDIHLAGEMDGIEAAAEIVKRFNIPVIFLTAFADKATLDRAKVLEPYGYILKPFRQTELRTVIELALHKHSAGKKEEKPKVEKPETAVVAKAIPDFRKQLQIDSPPSAVMQTTIVNYLESTPPFAALGTEFLRAMAAVSMIRSHKSYEVIISEGEKPAAGFLVIDGRVAVHKTSSGGKELVVELLGPSSLFGIVAVLDGTPSPFSAKTQAESRLLWIPREVIAHIIESYPEVSRELFVRVLERLRKAHDLSRALAHDKVEVRVASALLAIGESFAEKPREDAHSFEFEMTRQELGELVGTTPETVSRILNRMESDQIVDLSQTGKVRIVHHRELLSLIENRG